MAKRFKSLENDIAAKLIGQDAAIDTIVPLVRVYQAGLNPPDRPAMITLLLGPTGSGKTHSVEVLAEVLHGSRNRLIRVDCAEMQQDHEVARLVGAPPGYLGHRETAPLITQAKLLGATSDRCSASIVLFDEIEKGSPALHRLLLGIMDKGRLQTGDGNSVQFERSFVFMTSNVGAKAIQSELAHKFGFAGASTSGTKAVDALALAAAKRKFAPEFMNRLDAVVTYKPLTPEQLREILKLEIVALRDQIVNRLGKNAFFLVVTEKALDWLLARGTSREYGARELKRTVQREIAQPLAKLVVDGKVAANSLVKVNANGDRLTIKPSALNVRKVA